MKSLIYALGGFLNCKLRVASCVLWVTLKLLVASYFCWDYKLRVMSWTLKLRVTKNFRDLTKKVAKVTKGEGDAARNIDATHTNFFCSHFFRNSYFCSSVSHEGMIITARKMKFSIKDFFNKCDQIRKKLRIW